MNKEFYKTQTSIGAIIVIVGFFLPWISMGPFSFSGYDAPKLAEMFSGMERSMRHGNNSSGTQFYYILYFIPLLSGYLLYGEYKGEKKYFNPAKIAIFLLCAFVILKLSLMDGHQNIFEIAGIGIWVTFGGSVFLLIKLIKEFQKPIVAIPTQSSSQSVDPKLETTQPQIAVNTIQQTSNFDIGAWINKNKKILIGIVSSVIVLFVVYFLFLKNDPAKDGQNSAIANCDCAKNSNEQMIECYKKFIADFDSYKFSGRQEANQKLQSLIQDENNKSQQCYLAGQEKYKKLKEKYITDADLSGKFDYAFNAQQGLCNNNNSNDVNTLYNLAINKINGYIGSAEREQAKQDSIAAIQAAQVAQQQELAFVEATKTPPSMEKIKEDLLGKKVSIILNGRNGGWEFDKLADIKNINSLGATFQNNTHTYIGNIEMTLYDNRQRCNYYSRETVTYIWDGNTNMWNFQNVVSNEFTKMK